MVEEVTILPVPVDYIDKLWKKVSPLLNLALNRGGEDTLESTRERLEKREELLLVAVQGEDILAAGVLELVTTHAKTFAIIKLCGGKNMEVWKQTGMETVKRLAKEQGAQEIRIIGRKGWGKLNGFEEAHREFSMRI